MTAPAATAALRPVAGDTGGVGAASRFCYALAPGLTLSADDGCAGSPGGGVLAADRPLMAMRFNAAGLALLEALRPDGSTAALAARRAGVTTAQAHAFLDRLVRRRLLSRTPIPAPAHSPADWPRVSIIIAARGRHLSTRACLRSLLALDYPGAAPEIIVVDDASAPPLAPALAGLPVRLLRLPENVGQAAARNRGVQAATGAIIAFIDNDCLADPAWLRRLVPHFADPATVIVGGRVLAPPASGLVARYEAGCSPLDMGPVAGPVGPAVAIGYLPTCNFLVRRDVFLATTGFAPEMRVGEDVDFCWRVLAAGGQASYDPAGKVVHRHRLQLLDLLRRRADYGSSEADLQRRHPGSRRLLPLPALTLVLLTALTVATAGALTPAAALAALALVLLGQEIAARRLAIRTLRPGLPTRVVAAAVLRAHAAALYRLSGSVSRYYGLPLAAAAILVPVLLPAALLLGLTAPLIDHRRLAPDMPAAAFVSLHTLEMAAYQLGVWRGCLARRSFQPLLPVLCLRR